jgi:hypothetical protein
MKMESWIKREQQKEAARLPELFKAIMIKYFKEIGVEVKNRSYKPLYITVYKGEL